MLWTFIFLLVLAVIFYILARIYTATQPEFGRAPSKEDQKKYQQSEQFRKTKFVNAIPTSQGDFWEVLKTLPKFFNNSKGAPTDTLPSAYPKACAIDDSLSRVTWLGHSAFLIEHAGLRILIDPMLGPVASPFSFGSKRFPTEAMLKVEDFENIDVVVISHDHYDHLDYPSISKLKEQYPKFYTPLGVGSHLKAWGVPSADIQEMDWWDETQFRGLRLRATPARHFSGRALNDRNATLWAGWILDFGTQKLFFSGDGGYGPHYKEIGEKEGPFDFAMMECGQYNQAWGDIHMMPEESVKAAIEVQAKLAMPIHWGSFKLSVHSWTEPVERFVKAAEDQGLAYIHPKIGACFNPLNPGTTAPWWLELDK